MRHTILISFLRRPNLLSTQVCKLGCSSKSNVNLKLRNQTSQIFPQRCLVTSSCNFSLPDSKVEVPDEKNKAEKPVDIGGGTWQEIYEGLLSTQVKLIKGFSLGTSVIGLSIQPIVISHLGESMSLLVSFSALIGMFTFVTPALIHWFTRKYVFKLRYDPEKDLYAATTLSFFLREKTIHFKPSDVTIPEMPTMFTTFIVNNKPLFVDMDTFKDIEHFGRIMGYDKPLDLYVDAMKKKT